MPSAQQWSELDASNAWSDLINVWFNIDEPKMPYTEADFSVSIMFNIHASTSTNCGRVGSISSCETIQTCGWFEGFGNGTGDSGPAAMLIYNSFVIINQVSLAPPALKQNVMERERERQRRRRCDFASIIRVADTNSQPRCTPNTTTPSMMLLERTSTASSRTLRTPSHRVWGDKEPIITDTDLQGCMDVPWATGKLE